MANLLLIIGALNPCLRIEAGKEVGDLWCNRACCNKYVCAFKRRNVLQTMKKDSAEKRSETPLLL